MTKRAGLLRVSITKNVTVNVTKVYDGWLQILFQKRAKFLLTFFLKYIRTIHHQWTHVTVNVTKDYYDWLQIFFS